MQFDPKSVLVGFLLAVVLYYVFYRRMSRMTGGPESFPKALEDSCPDGYEKATDFLCVKKK
jgi:hypothetical protein